MEEEVASSLRTIDVGALATLGRFSRSDWKRRDSDALVGYLR
jgi:hypothetical protein